jgi:hypothetical protein
LIVYWLAVLEAGKFNIKALTDLTLLIPRWWLERCTFQREEALHPHMVEGEEGKED